MNYRVILVENKDSGLETLKQEMNKRGYEIIDYQESITRINDFNPKLPSSTFLLVDITTPFLNGYRFTEKMNNKNTKIKNIAILSGFISDEDIDSITSLGGRVFPKPFDLVSLLDWLEIKKDHELPDIKVIEK